MREAVIVSPLRTAVGTYGGKLKGVSAVELASLVIKEVVQRSGIAPEDIEEVIIGSVLQAGLGQNVARQAALRADLPPDVPCLTINKVCGSGLKSITMAANAILSGEAEIIIAGGTENMSAAPYSINGARWGLRMGDGQLVDLMIKDGLWCSISDYHMGITAENVAEKYGITREEQDLFACKSQEKADKAIKSGKFKDEIVPVIIPQKKGEPLVFDTDEHPRLSSLEALANLKPAFKKDGTVTAGNASGINDGAAAVLVMSREKAEKMNIQYQAVIKSYASSGVEPSIMGTGPIPATRKTLDKAGWTVGDIELIEANEAFAAQALSVMKELEFDPAKVNLNGGAIALGHPIGASGARIFVSLIHEMIKQDAKKGLATLCIGGGQGIACAVER